MSQLAEQTLSWRAFRERDLRSEWSWLSLVGLFWLHEGLNTIGSNPESTVILPKEAFWVGDIEIDGTTLYLHPALNVPFKINDKLIVGKHAIQSDVEGQPTDIRLGDYSLTVIRRSGQLAVRLRDKESPIRTNFPGLRYFPENPDLHITGHFYPYETTTIYRAATAIGKEEDETLTGYITFEKNGKKYRFEAQERKGGRLFITFKDTTSGKSTYGACRFLLVPAPKDGVVLLDFNAAYNPPCAFTPWATCSLPHPNNRLDFAVEAGELSPLPSL